MIGNNGIKFFLQLLDFTCRDFNIRGLPLGTSHRLVYHHAGVVNAERLPSAPATSNTAAMLAAIPVQMVATSLLMNCMVS